MAYQVNLGIGAQASITTFILDGFAGSEGGDGGGSNPGRLLLTLGVG